MPSDAPEFIFGDRLSPLPEDRTNIIRIDRPVDVDQEHSWEEENRKFVKRALKNVVYVPDYPLGEHQRRADIQPPLPDDRSWRGGELVEVLGDKPTFICGSDGVMAALVIPAFLKRLSLCQVNTNALDFMALELTPTRGKEGLKPAGSSSNGKARGGVDTYKTDQGVFGTATYVVAWHQRGHERSNSYEPLRSLTRSKSGLHSHLRGRYLSGTRNMNIRIIHLVSLVHPQFDRLLRSVQPLIADHPTVRQVQSLWSSNFLGLSVIMNRTSGEHLDSNGIQRGMDVLLAAGSFSGGDIFFKDRSLKIRFEPGTLVLFDGTAQRHSIMQWSGEQRISHAFFVHRYVFEELGLDTCLPDVSLESIKETLWPPTGSTAAKRKRKGLGRGRSATAKRATNTHS